MSEKEWNQKASQIHLKLILSHFHRVSSTILLLNQEKGLNGLNFMLLIKISEQERIEIIQKGFQRQAEGKISLKKYYESTEEYSLFQIKGFHLRYETLRRAKLYKSLKG